jgi:hypothetical protein
MSFLRKIVLFLFPLDPILSYILHYQPSWISNQGKNLMSCTPNDTKIKHLVIEPPTKFLALQCLSCEEKFLKTKGFLLWSYVKVVL